MRNFTDNLLANLEMRIAPARADEAHAEDEAIDALIDTLLPLFEEYLADTGVNADDCEQVGKAS